MPTVQPMFKRILVLTSGLVLGICLLIAARRASAAWSIWPNRDLAKASGYVKDVMKLVNESYVDESAATYDKLARNALHGMIESLDPHSEFLEAKDNAEFEEDLVGEFGGIGVQVETRDNRVIVIAPLAGTPGERAGIQRGDEIVSIDGRTIEGSSSVDAVIDRLRGKPKTRVALRLFRPTTQQTFNLTLVREVIKIESVRDPHVIDGDVGYVQLTEFSEHTAEQFRAALEPMLHDNIRALVLDLRNNPGGLLDAAVEIAEPFFRKGELIVYTQGRKKEDHDEYRAESAGPSPGPAHCDPDQCRQRQCGRGVDGRVEGHQSSRRGRRALVRQRIGSVRFQAEQWRRPAVNHRALLHAERRQHSRKGHRTARGGRDDPR
jgi:carboxyl-terminal processing protease